MTCDGVRAFARHMLKGDRLTLRPVITAASSFAGVALEGVLYREGAWQVQLITVLPNARIPRHRHNRVDSVDLLLSGDGAAIIGERIIKGPRGRLLANLVPVPRGQWHGGSAGPNGAVYLSFQKWDGVPTLISEDWEAWLQEPK